ncbi:hypothetical protein GCM10023148_29270 [Actinokineospora soli]
MAVEWRGAWRRPYRADSVDAAVSLDDSLRLAVYRVAAGGAARNVRR